MVPGDKYELVVGLEVHVQLLTKSKLFCADSTEFGEMPNSRVSPLSLGHPGTLPRLNGKAVELGVILGSALGSQINPISYFARKHYFYPDLPKGYQISQHEMPICSGGMLEISSEKEERFIELHHMHLEEDAGKSMHAAEGFSQIDLNRAGMPLLEIVSQPCIHSSGEAGRYLTELRRLVRWLGVSDGNMEQGSMRCDANISIRPKGSKTLGTRVEVKNLNSIRNVKRAIEYEFSRMISLAEKNIPQERETRSFDDESGSTFSLRAKEDSEDYRYFPDPDLPPVIIPEEMTAAAYANTTRLPRQIEKELIQEGLAAQDASAICADRAFFAYFMELNSHIGDIQAAANWMMGPVKNYCNNQRAEISAFPVPAPVLARLAEITTSGKISFSNGSGKVFLALVKNPGKDPLALATELELLQESDDEVMESWVTEVLEKMPEKVAEYKSGKKGLLALFAGEVKKISKGTADMEKAIFILKKKLNT